MKVVPEKKIVEKESEKEGEEKKVSDTKGMMMLR